MYISALSMQVCTYVEKQTERETIHVPCFKYGLDPN